MLSLTSSGRVGWPLETGGRYTTTCQYVAIYQLMHRHSTRSLTRDTVSLTKYATQAGAPHNSVPPTGRGREQGTGGDTVTLMYIYIYNHATHAGSLMHRGLPTPLYNVHVHVYPCGIQPTTTCTCTCKI